MQKFMANVKEFLTNSKEFWKSLLTGVLVFLTMVLFCGLLIYLFQYVWFLIFCGGVAILFLLTMVGHMAREIWKV
jgi:uncharacterized membrane protein